MMNNTANDNCSGIYGDVQGDVLLAVNVTLSSISCFLILGMIFIIVLFKKYKFFTQRLILYVAVTSFIFNLTTALNFTSEQAYTSMPARRYCIAVGFFYQVSIWWEFMAITCIIIDIFIKVVLGKFTEHLEIFYIVLIIITPLTFSWIPFLNGIVYGPAGSFCWIRTNEYLELECNQNYFGVALRFALFYVPIYILLIFLVILLCLSIYVIRRRRKEWVSQSDQEIITIQKTMEREIRSLIVYPIIFIVLNIIPFAHRVYGIFPTNENVFFVLSLITAIVYSIQGAIITFAFTLDPETRKKLKWIEIKAAIIRWRGKDGVVSVYQAERIKSDSLFESNSSYTKLI